MGLGNFDIASFKPKRSETAASLLTVAPQQDTKKTERTEFRIRSDIKKLFEEICIANGTDVSSAIRAYIENSVSSGSMTNKTAFSDLYVQNVRTNKNGPILRESRGFSACGELNLRNKEEREQWLNNFRSWGVWLNVPEVDKKFYRYDLKNKVHERISYSIIDSDHKQFNSQGDSFTMVIQWLTKYSKEL